MVRVTDKRNNCSAILCPLEEGGGGGHQGEGGEKERQEDCECFRERVGEFKWMKSIILSLA